MSSLKESLISYWPLNELSGIAYDNQGTNHLTDNNTVGNGVGQVYSIAREFIALNSEFFSIPSNDSLDIATGSFSFASWQRPGVITDQVVLRKYLAASPGTFDYSFRLNSGTGKYRWSVDGTTLDATSFTPTLDEWDLTIIWHDAVAQTINIQSENGTVDSTAHVAGGSNNGDTFGIGGIPVSFWQGRIGPVMFSKRVWTTEERTSIWNNGLGLKFEQLEVISSGIAGRNKYQGWTADYRS